MVLNFRSRDKQFRGIFLGCFAVVVDLEILAGPALARLLCHELTTHPPNPPCPPNVLCLLEGGPYAGPRMEAIRFLVSCQMAAKTVSGTRHSSEKMVPLSTLWKGVLWASGCSGHTYLSREISGTMFLPVMRGLVSITWGLITVIFAIVAVRHGHMLFVTRNKAIHAVWRLDPPYCTHTQSPSPQG